MVYVFLNLAVTNKKMFEILRAYFERSFPITKENFALLKSVMIPKTLKKENSCCVMVRWQNMEPL